MHTIILHWGLLSPPSAIAIRIATHIPWGPIPPCPPAPSSPAAPCCTRGNPGQGPTAPVTPGTCGTCDSGRGGRGFGLLLPQGFSQGQGQGHHPPGRRVVKKVLAGKKEAGWTPPAVGGGLTGWQLDLVGRYPKNRKRAQMKLGWHFSEKKFKKLRSKTQNCNPKLPILAIFDAFFGSIPALPGGPKFLLHRTPGGRVRSPAGSCDRKKGAGSSRRPKIQDKDI